MIRPRRWGKARRSVDRIDGGMSRLLLKIAQRRCQERKPMRACCAVQGWSRWRAWPDGAEGRSAGLVIACGPSAEALGSFHHASGAFETCLLAKRKQDV